MIPQMPFGGTGHISSRLIFGAAALGSCRQEVADRILAQVSAAGINHIDTAAGYGESEVRLAPWLAANRSSVYLATKTGERDGDAARAQLEESLIRLGVDSIDLIQLHNLVEPEEWDTAFAINGALSAMVKAQAEGLVKHIGVTGHGLRIAHMHLRSLEAFPFDTVLLPWNYMLSTLEGYHHDFRQLQDLCRERNVAMQTIKSVARGRWPGGRNGTEFSWYEPLNDPDAIARAVRFVLSEDNLFVNTSSDTRVLQSIVAGASAANATQRPTDAELNADVASFGITPLFDGADLERI
jgi:aryl-alcohol dehydrogenase-like predicted oxidoreductase